MNEIKVAIVGFGGISRAHNNGYAKLVSEGFPVKVTAICDKDPERIKKATEINLGGGASPIPETAEIFYDIDELIEKGDFDMADICLPTYLHMEVACKMMRAGKHVLSEKPMALNSEQCEEMIKVRDETGMKLMIAQCLRFSPKYLYLKECIDSGCFGKLKNIFMDRLSKYPLWGSDHWFEKTELSGGCILDTHIHDLDMARFLLGEPETVSAASYDGISRWQLINSRLFYDGVTVIANGSWDEADSLKFKMGYRTRFEKASVVFDGDVTVYPDGGEPFKPEISDKDFYTEEIRFFVNMLLDDTLKNECNPAESAYKSVKLVEALRRSAALGGDRVAPI